MHINASRVLVESTSSLETAIVESVSIDRSGGSSSGYGEVPFLRGESQGSLGATRVPKKAINNRYSVVLLLRETFLGESLQLLIGF